MLYAHVDNNGAFSNYSETGGSGGSDCRFEVASKLALSVPVAEPRCSPNPVEGDSDVPVHAEATGLDPNTEYVYRVVAANEGGSSTASPDEDFRTSPNVPTAANDPPSSVTQATAVLHGRVDNEGAEGGSSCKFVVVRRNGSSALPPETLVAEPPCDQDPVTGDGDTAVQASLSGLDPNVEYAYRVVVHNESGGASGTPDQAFSTLPDAPSAGNDPATAITQTTAVLHGHVDNEAAEGGSACKFVVARASSLDVTVAEPPCDPTPIEGDTSVAVLAEVTGLDPNTAYVYHIVAESTGGSSVATPDGEFATPPDPPMASFSVSPASPMATQPVAFDASASTDPDGSIADYSWNFGDGSHASGTAASHTYAHAGRYTVELTVGGVGGPTDSASEVVQVDDAPPLASFSVNTRSPTTTQPVAFDASASSDPDGSIASYS
jgi:chitodextrinase